MITQPTVFVLGAGASMPYRYPSGQRLVDQISSGSEQNDFDEMRSQAGFEDSQMDAFRRVLTRGKPPSIDAFLESNPNFLEIGKFCIAQRLLTCESDSGLFGESEAQHWYTAFFRQLAPNKDSGFRNNVTIVTFNYDRSLEHFLYEAFSSAFGASETEARDFVRRLNIIHVHGKLGDLPWESDMGFPYGEVLTLARIRTAVDGIKIIHETDGKEAAFEDAGRALMIARYIFFLGFGYHELNLKRLKIPFDRIPRYEGDAEFHVSGTCYEATNAQVDMLLGRLKRQVTLPGAGFRIHEFMREYPSFLYAAEGRHP